MELKDTIRKYIGEELLDDQTPIGDEDNLLADGMVDSIGMLRLIAFIEASYGIKVPLEDITIENFRTIESLDRYLTSATGIANGANDNG